MTRNWILIAGFLALQGSALAQYAGVTGGIVLQAAPSVDLSIGEEGQYCVGLDSKIVDTITSSVGNVATVKAISGPARQCKKPELPIRAALEFQFPFTPRVSMQLPPVYVQAPLTDSGRHVGLVLAAKASHIPRAAILYSRPRTPSTDIEQIARQYAQAWARQYRDFPAWGPLEKAEINGVRAVYVVSDRTGPVRASAHRVTVFEGDNEIAVLVAYTPIKQDFNHWDPELEILDLLASRVTGLKQDKNGESAVPIRAPSQK